MDFFCSQNMNIAQPPQSTSTTVKNINTSNTNTTNIRTTATNTTITRTTATNTTTATNVTTATNTTTATNAITATEDLVFPRLLFPCLSQGVVCRMSVYPSVRPSLTSFISEKCTSRT